MCFVFAMTAGQPSGMLLGLFFLGWGAVVWYLRYGRCSSQDSSSRKNVSSTGAFSNNEVTCTPHKQLNCTTQLLREDHTVEQTAKTEIDLLGAEKIELSSADEHCKAMQSLIVEGFGLLEDNLIPAVTASRIADLLLKAGNKAGEVAFVQMLDKRGIEHKGDKDACLKEADRLLGSGIELMAESGLDQNSARRITDTFIKAGQEAFNYHVMKLKR